MHIDGLAEIPHEGAKLTYIPSLAETRLLTLSQYQAWLYAEARAGFKVLKIPDLEGTNAEFEYRKLGICGVDRAHGSQRIFVFFSNAPKPMDERMAISKKLGERGLKPIFIDHREFSAGQAMFYSNWKTILGFLNPESHSVLINQHLNVIVSHIRNHGSTRIGPIVERAGNPQTETVSAICLGIHSERLRADIRAERLSMKTSIELAANDDG